MTTTLDILIVGGGPAGMAAALVAGRARLRTLVVDAQAPRNAVSHASHGFLTRDGAHASELRTIALEQLGKYPSVRYLHEAVVDAELTAEGVSVVGASRERWLTKRLVLAAGYRTELGRLGISGMEEVYGRSVFPCPFCDGFENADRAIAVFGHETAGHMGAMLRIWSDDVAVFTNGHALDEAAATTLEARGIPVHEGRIARLSHEDGQLRAVVLEDGTAVRREAGFVGEEHAVPATGLAESLGIARAVDAWGREHFAADELGKTNVEGVYLVGDMKRVFGGITAAAHDGYMCLVGIVREMAMG